MEHYTLENIKLTFHTEDIINDFQRKQHSLAARRHPSICLTAYVGTAAHSVCDGVNAVEAAVGLGLGPRQSTCTQ